MKQVIVSEGQSWFDVAVQELGTVEGVFGLMGSADVLSDYPEAGRVIRVEPVDGLASGDVAMQRLYISSGSSPVRRVVVSDGQSWFDVAVQELGSVEGVFEMMTHGRAPGTCQDVLSDYPDSGRLIKITEEVLALEYEQPQVNRFNGLRPIEGFVTVLQDQSWFDLAVQELGSVEGVFGMMTHGRAPGTCQDLLDGIPTSGRVVKVMASDIVVKNYVDYYQQKGITPVTGLLTDYGGIGFWRIGVDFVVG